jgi:hypothetical protein
MNTQEMIHDLVDNAIKKAEEAVCDADGDGEENEEMNVDSQQQLRQASQQQGAAELVKTSRAMVTGASIMEEVEGREGGNDADDGMVVGSLEI